jgi:lipoprotein-releasing system permease protein
MRLGFKIGARFLKSNIGQTILIILGISIGVSVQIFIGSLIQGLQKSLVDKTIGNASQITVTADAADKKLNNYDEIIKLIQSADKDITTISPVSDHPVFLDREENAASLLLRGFDLTSADEIYNLKKQLVEGIMPVGRNEVILGTDIKDKYDLHTGEDISVITPEKELVTLTIKGFYDLKVKSINTTWAITNLETSQDIFKEDGKITSVEIQVKDSSVFSADIIGNSISTALQGRDVTITNWKEQNEQLLSGLKGQSISSYMIQIFVLISVVLGIASVLAISVLQKSKQIGILKAMGMKNRMACYVFLSQGIILGGLGAAFGIVLGLGLSYGFSTFALNPDGTPIVALYLNKGFISISVLVALLSSVAASLLPAVKSARLNPVDIIRNN